ncbi:MAG: 2'-5' RNA ligase family protein [Herpetosiphonaceae bacterium]|nr:2'-5' RNA ligase family protein [Herpetosiphonaceae bacterium]
MERFIMMRAMWRIWPVVRPIVGWLCIVLGILGIILPILQGIIFLVIGATLIGRHHPLIRWFRVRYKQLLRTWRRSPNRLLAWIGRRGEQALAILERQMLHLRQHFQLRAKARRRFRVVLIAPAAVRQQLNHWRSRYDPAYRNDLPPHIVLVATSRSSHRPQFEQDLARLCGALEPFQIKLDQVVLDSHEHRIFSTVGSGAPAIRSLREQIARIAPAELRFSQRQLWPCLTLGKIRHQSSLRSAYESIQRGFEPQTWSATEVVLLEERIGSIWHEVRLFSFNRRLLARSNDASPLIVEEAL